MSVKTFTFRYDSDGDIGKWMAAQANKSVSLELAIQTLIGNFDYQDLREAIPRQVTLNAVDVNAAKLRIPPNICTRCWPLPHTRKPVNVWSSIKECTRPLKSAPVPTTCS